MSVLFFFVHASEYTNKQTNAKVLPRLQEYQSYGWWVGEKNGNIGIVPKDYLMELYAL